MTLREAIPRLIVSSSMPNAFRPFPQSQRRPVSTKKTDIASLVKAVEVIEIEDSDDEIQVMKEPKSKAPKQWPPRRAKNRLAEEQEEQSTCASVSNQIEQIRATFAHGPQRPRTSTSKNSALPTRARPPVISKRTIMQSAKPTAFPVDDVSPEQDLPQDLVPQPLPKYSYKDYTKPKAYHVYIKDEAEADDLVDSLRPGPVAMDMEWRVIKRFGQGERRTALVQVADTAGLILLIQVYNMARFPRRLVKLLEDADIPKLGANILGDGKKLFRDYGILCKNLVELGAVAQIVDPESQKTKRKVIALAKLVEQYCGKELEKGAERTSNWEDPLTTLQCEYAANDAHCSVMIYQRLLELGRENGANLSEASTFFSANVQMLYETPPISRSSSVETTASASSGTSVRTDDTELTIPDTVDSQETTTTKPVAPTLQRTASKPFVKSQHMRAYKFWHEKNMALERMCKELSLKGQGFAEGKPGDPLKGGTVISYVIGALTSDPSLPFDMRKLRELVQMEIGSWVRHREWILQAHQDGRGLPQADNI